MSSLRRTGLDLEKRYNATEAKVNDESLPEWSIGVFAALGVLALLVAIVLCMVIKCDPAAGAAPAVC